ncbi:MAG: hypothetical protein HY720_25180 [Planctomycetes bacterium]|nr:hypothetical protein [Planctomycetota bacterium]
MNARHLAACAMGILLPAGVAFFLLVPNAVALAIPGLGPEDMLAGIACVETVYFLFLWTLLVSRGEARGEGARFLPLLAEAAAVLALLLPVATLAGALAGRGLREAFAVQGWVLLVAAASAAVAHEVGRRPSRVPLLLYLAAGALYTGGVPLARLVVREVVFAGEGEAGGSTPLEVALGAAGSGGPGTLLDPWTLGPPLAVAVAALLPSLFGTVRRKSAAALALLLALAAGTAGAAEIESVRFLAGDSFRPGEWTLAEVVVSDGPFAGEVEIAVGTHHRFRQPVRLAAEGSREAVLVPCLLRGRWATSTVRLVDRGCAVAEREAALPSRAVKPLEVLVGVHPAGSLAPAADGDALRAGGRRVTIADLSFLPGEPGGWAGVDVLLAAPPPASRLEAYRPEILEGWIRAGGRLVLASPQLVTAGGWSALLFPGGLGVVEGPPGFDPVENYLKSAGVPASRWIRTGGGKPIGAALELGRGRVAVLGPGVALGSTDAPVLSAVLARVLDGLPERVDRSISPEAYEAFGPAGWNDETLAWSARWTAIYLLVACGIAGAPLIVWRRSQRTGLALSLALAVAVAVPATLLAGRSEPARTECLADSQPVLVVEPGGDLARALDYHRLTGRSGDSVDVRAPGWDLLPVSFDEEHFHDTAWSGGPQELSGIALPEGSRFAFVAERGIHLPGRVEASLEEGRLVVANGSGRDWRAAVLRDEAGRIAELGPIEDGGLARFELADLEPRNPGRKGSPLPGTSPAVLALAASAAGVARKPSVIALLSGGGERSAILTRANRRERNPILVVPVSPKR